MRKLNLHERFNDRYLNEGLVYHIQKCAILIGLSTKPRKAAL